MTLREFQSTNNVDSEMSKYGFEKAKPSQIL